jgi:hypothetical protein
VPGILGSAGAIPLLEPDRFTCRVQSKDPSTGLVLGDSRTVIVAEAAEAVRLGGDDRGRYERTDARFVPDECEPLAASVAVKEPTGALAKLAAVEARNVEIGEARDGSAEMREQHAGHPAKREGLVPPQHTGVVVAGMLDLDGEGAIALEGRHAGHGGVLIARVYRIAPG